MKEGPSGSATKLANAHDQQLRAVRERDYAASSKMLNIDRREIVAAAQAALREAERIVAEHDAEVARIKKQLAELQPRSARQASLIETCRKWAAANHVPLPGDPNQLPYNVRLPEAPPYARPLGAPSTFTRS